MRICETCSAELTRDTQKKFCSRSCAAKKNNIGKRRHGESPGFCVVCGNKTSAYCRETCSNICRGIHERRETIARWQRGEISGNMSAGKRGIAISTAVRSYLFTKHDNKCSRCGWSEVNPFTGKIPLTVEHIDGNAENSAEENLDLICPNCHSLTGTYGGLNKGQGRKLRV